MKLDDFYHLQHCFHLYCYIQNVLSATEVQACHPLNHFFMEIVTSLTGKSSYVKKSAHFEGWGIMNAPVHSNQMVTLYVVSLFTRVLTDEMLTVVQDKLAADSLLEEHTCILIDNLMEMLTFCVKTTYFGMGSDMHVKKRDRLWDHCCC